MKGEIILQKYLITDGKQYIRKESNSRRYVLCGSPIMADEFTYKQAENVIKNCLSQNLKKRFYIEGMSDFVKIVPQEVEELMTSSKENKRFSFDESILDKLEDITEGVIAIGLPDIKRLLSYKGDLEKAISFYDQAKSDFDHWEMNHAPPAHIRTKVYGLKHDWENKRARIKEKYEFLKVLIEATQEDYSFSKLQTELQRAKYVPYKPNTYVYEMLNDLLK